MPVASMAVAAPTAVAIDSSNEVIEIMKRETIKRTTFPLGILAMWATAALAQQPAQQTFPSAAEASKSLFQAVQRNDAQAITSIMGGPSDLASSHDEAQDKLDREFFVQKYQEMQRLGREIDESVTLYIGAENWPFPIPLVEKNGVWRFDSDAGLKEVLYRRIGENELSAITICHDFVAAAKHNGTQPNTTGPEDGPLTKLVASAAGEPAGGEPVLFHGYYFRELPIRPTSGTRQPGGRKARVALIAYPAEYRLSGVMTFIITDKDIVYEKDLGAQTSGLAAAMTAFHKDATWRPAAD
jgi:hypothetical protein